MQSQVTYVLIQNSANKKKMCQFLIQHLSPMFIVEKIIENVKVKHIKQNHQLLQKQFQAQMMKNLIMVQQNFKESFTKIALALMQIKHHAPTLNSLHSIKPRVFMILMVFLDWLFIQIRKEEISTMSGNLRTKVLLIRLLSASVSLDQEVKKSLTHNSEELIQIKLLVE